MKIAIGFATLLGTIGAAVALIIPFIGELTDTLEPLGVDPKVWVITSAVLAGVTVIGRMGQAIAAFLAQQPPAPPAPPA